MYEVEQKFPVESLIHTEAALCELGAAIGRPVAQRDVYVAHPCRDFQVSDEALRLRREGEANYFTYKGPKIDATTKTRREIEVQLPDGAAFFARFEELLAAVGFQPYMQVEKARRLAHVQWQDTAVEVALDEVAGLGSFVELELAAERDGVAAARSKLQALADVLGLRGGERRSYCELLTLRRSGASDPVQEAGLASADRVGPHRPGPGTIADDDPEHAIVCPVRSV